MENGRQIPTYRILDGVGKPLDGAKVPDVCVSPPRLHHYLLTK